MSNKYFGIASADFILFLWLLLPTEFFILFEVIYYIIYNLHDPYKIENYY